MSRLITGGESPVCEGREIRGEEIIHLDNWTQHLKDLKEKLSLSLSLSLSLRCFHYQCPIAVQLMPNIRKVTRSLAHSLTRSLALSAVH